MSLVDSLVAAFQRSDHELGAQMLLVAIADKIQELGVPAEKITPELAEQIRKTAADVDTDTADLVAVEKAFHKAAAGDFTAAGRLLRQHLTNGAIQLKTQQELERERSLRNARSSAGGKKTAEAKRTANFKRDKKIRDDYAALVTSGTALRDAPAKLAIRHNLSAKQIKRIVNP